MKPIFSVITVHYNQLSDLKLTVENIIGQKGMGDFIEYLIIDGASTDGTIDYLETIPAQNNFIWISEKDTGIYEAMNKGIRRSRGDYIIFINAGDRLKKMDTLFSLRDFVQDKTIVFGDTEIEYNGFTRIAIANSLTEFWKSLPFIHQSVLIKREILLNNLFNMEYKFCADYNQLAGLYKGGETFWKFDGVIAIIKAGGASDQRRVDATKEVAEISARIFGSSDAQKRFFKKQISKGKWVMQLKKMLPEKWVISMTKRKYRKK